MRQRRTRKEQRRDSQDHYCCIAEQKVDAKAAERFNRPAYQVRKAIRAQGEQVEHKDMVEYLAEKYGIEMEVDASGERKLQH